MLHQKQLIIFDLDGTLVDSAPDIAAAANAMRVAMGYPEQSLEQVKQWVGNGSAMLVKRALAENCSARFIEAVHASKLADAASHERSSHDACSLKEGMRECHGLANNRFSSRRE